MPEPPLLPDLVDRDEIDDATEDALFSRIPMMAETRKTSYLSYRACGFGPRTACDLVPISFRTLMHWRANDPVFKDFETNRLHELQGSIAGDILKLEFFRNLKLIMKRDFRVFKKAVYNWAGLTPEEHRYLLKARANYTMGDLLALERALAPDGPAPDSTGVNVNVFVNEVQVATEEARRAAARDLLQKFTTTARLVEEVKAEDDNPNPDNGA